MIIRTLILLLLSFEIYKNEKESSGSQSIKIKKIYQTKLKKERIL